MPKIPPAALKTQPEPAMVRIDDALLQRLTPAKKHGEPQVRVNSVDFVADGSSFIAAFSDDSVGIYDLKTGTRDKSQVNSKKYGVGLIRFTHNLNSAVHSSTKVDNTIRYLSLYDNKYLRYFQGHSQQVTALSMSPVDDMFLSASLDKTIRLWDLRTNSCQGLMQVSGRPVTAFDPEGLIFAAGINSEAVKLYDLRSFDKGPFTNFKVDKDHNNVDWTSMEFAPDGRSILLNTNGDYLKLLDAFKGDVKHVFRGHRNDSRVELEAGFSPDSQYVTCGSTNGVVVFYNAETGAEAARLQNPEERGVIRFARWNPKFCMLATADHFINFWIPPEELAAN